MNIKKLQYQREFDYLQRILYRVSKNSKTHKLLNSDVRSVEEIATVAEHLHQMTEELNAKLNEFKT